jgi:mycofactocin precursor
MPATTTVAEPAAPPTPTTPTTPEPDSLVTDELLVEEISIDGMCGVY